jgi:hypothetical protein
MEMYVIDCTFTCVSLALVLADDSLQRNTESVTGCTDNKCLFGNDSLLQEHKDGVNLKFGTFLNS